MSIYFQGCKGSCQWYNILKLSLVCIVIKNMIGEILYMELCLDKSGSKDPMNG